jgi:DNA-binding IclR family transcriptional regulator
MPGPNVTAVERVIDIYEAFQASQRPMSLTDLAEAVDIPKSTCHAIVSTLMARGYLYSLTRPRSLYPTKRMHDVASDILAKDPFIERAAPMLEKLRDESGETVILGKRQGDAVVYLQVVQSTHPIRYSARPGDIKPLHSSSIGKALLGSLTTGELLAWVDGRNLPSVTRSTITDAAALVADIARGRAAGYFQTRGENVADVWAVAVPVAVNNETLAIAVAGPGHRMEAALENCARRLVAACAGLQQATK